MLGNWKDFRISGHSLTSVQLRIESLFLLYLCLGTPTWQEICSLSSNTQFSRSVLSDSLWPHGLQHARLPCPSPTPGAYSNSCPSSQWCHPTISRPLLSPSLPAFNYSQHQGLFKWVSSSYQVAKYWSFSFNIRPSNDYSGLISFRMDWLDLFAVQGTLKNLFHHHSSKALILWLSAFSIAQLLHP